MRNNCADVFLDDIIQGNSIIPVGVIWKDVGVQHTPCLQLLLYLPLAVKPPAVKPSSHELKDSLHTLGHTVVHPATRGHQFFKASPVTLQQ